MTTPKRRAAKKPAPRTVTVSLTGEFEGWEMTAKADFPAKVLALLQSDMIDDITTALDKIVVDHNFPDSDGEVAKTMADVDPFEGMRNAAMQLFEELGKLPNR